MSVKFTFNPHGEAINLYHVVSFKTYPYTQLLISTARYNGTNIYAFIEGNPFYFKPNALIKKIEDCPVYPTQVYDLLEDVCAFEFDDIADIIGHAKDLSVKNTEFKIKTFFFVKNAMEYLKELKK